jgi:hypothetical protein
MTQGTQAQSQSQVKKTSRLKVREGVTIEEVQPVRERGD